MPTPSTQKLQKILAMHGLGSRRLMEAWIIEGRISVNGERAEIGCRIDNKAIISVDGKVLPPLASSQDIQILMYHKPIGEICTRKDPENRRTVFDALSGLMPGRWTMVGRLDLNTAGLLLFTNDGECANTLMHPSFHIEREYRVRVYGEITQDKLARLKKGVRLEDGIARFDYISTFDAQQKKTQGNFWFNVTVSQGRNRIVRRLWESQGIQVTRLSRVRFGKLVMPDTLKAGQYQFVSLQDIVENYGLSL
jgi:23S rRNA pseudouridine2605 synthase